MSIKIQADLGLGLHDVEWAGKDRHLAVLNLLDVSLDLSLEHHALDDLRVVDSLTLKWKE